MNDPRERRRDERADDEKSGQTSSQASKSAPRIPLADLLRGHREAIIDHDGNEYRLRLTSAGKLILTK